MKKKTGRSARKTATKRSRRKSSTSSTKSHVPTRGLYGWITHTELASADPTATKAWCAKVLGWTFMPSVPMPGVTIAVVRAPGGVPVGFSGP